MNVDNYYTIKEKQISLTIEKIASLELSCSCWNKEINRLCESVGLEVINEVVLICDLWEECYAQIQELKHRLPLSVSNSL